MDTFSIESRRYIGNKAKLIDWIMEVIGEEASDAQSFVTFCRYSLCCQPSDTKIQRGHSK